MNLLLQIELQARFEIRRANYNKYVHTLSHWFYTYT